MPQLRSYLHTYDYQQPAAITNPKLTREQRENYLVFVGRGSKVVEDAPPGPVNQGCRRPRRHIPRVRIAGDQNAC